MRYLSQSCILPASLYSTEILLSHKGDPEPDPPRSRDFEGEAPDHQSQILLIGDHPTLQYSRRKVLESVGYGVASARSDLVVEELFLRGIELVLLCHTVPEHVAAHIVTVFARRAPQIGVLRVSLVDDSCEDRGSVTWIPARPAAMLHAIAAKLSHS